jgi:hypothetical protein
MKKGTKDQCKRGAVALGHAIGHANLQPSAFILHPFVLEAMKGVEPLSTGLQDRRSGSQLSYIARKTIFAFCALFFVRFARLPLFGEKPCPIENKVQSSKHKDRFDLVELRGIEPLRPACRAGIMPLDHSPEAIADF